MQQTYIWTKWSWFFPHGQEQMTKEKKLSKQGQNCYLGIVYDFSHCYAIKMFSH